MIIFKILKIPHCTENIYCLSRYMTLNITNKVKNIRPCFLKKGPH